MSQPVYKDYFNIDPKYYAAVTAELIEEGKVSWKGFYPHPTFVTLLETVYRVLSGAEDKSVWVEGAYGTGKSHAALTVKSLLDASDEELREYFDDYKLNTALRDKYIALKNSGRILTVHRIGSANIDTDADLVLAVQQSILSALEAAGLRNQGDASMKDAFLQWMEKPANRAYFDALIKEERYAFDFAGKNAQSVVADLQNGTDEQTEKLMALVMRVLKDNGQTGLFTDAAQMSQWIGSVIDQNHLASILFVWDEFSEYFLKHPVGLTGFQTLAEISQSKPFYFMIVAHESRDLFVDAATAKKILDRFTKPVRIELPDNMAFRLMAQAMKKSDDSQMAKQWAEDANTLNDMLAAVRNELSARQGGKGSLTGEKTKINQEDLCAIVPMHPYAALVLKNIALLYNSNQRSMFDFVISPADNGTRGFKWFIEHYGALGCEKSRDIYAPQDDYAPLYNDCDLLTVDLLWDFFYGNGRTGLNSEASGILETYRQVDADKLLPEERRVLKVILLLQAISLKVSGQELLTPTPQNLDLAFAGTEWSKGRAVNIAEGLCDEHKAIVFHKPTAGGGYEYTVARVDQGARLTEIKEKLRRETTTKSLIVNAKLVESITIPEPVKLRYIVKGAGHDNFSNVLNEQLGARKPERISVIVSFAMDDTEHKKTHALVLKQMAVPTNELAVIETETPMGRNLFERYIENMANSVYFGAKDKSQATHYQKQAEAVLDEWKNNILSGAFYLYDPQHKDGVRYAGLPALQEALTALDRVRYPCCLEQYSLNATMYGMYQPKQGATFAINQELGGAFKTSNKKISFETALNGAWKVDNYWHDSAKQHLVIVRLKNRVEEMITNAFAGADPRISVLSIVDELEKPPFGIMPSALSAFVLGFVLKEYVAPEYFWSNGSNSEAMTAERMAAAIAEALQQKVNPDKKYKESFIVAMSAEKRAFLNATAEIFRIHPVPGSVEAARDRLRVAMKELSFPVWCLKYLREGKSEAVGQLLDLYCGIANTGNAGDVSESQLAEEIGKLLRGDQELTHILASIMDSEHCTAGMTAYIAGYRGGMLPKLAAQISDGGRYRDEVKKRFSAGDANWVWNTATADECIDKVIVDYGIVSESRRTLGDCSAINEAISGWNSRTNHIKISCDAMLKYLGDLAPFMQMLCDMKRSGTLFEQKREEFLMKLKEQREAFDVFYQDQFPVFEQTQTGILDTLSREEQRAFFETLPGGQFTKSKADYNDYVQGELKKYLESQLGRKLRNLWQEKTGFETPARWSEAYSMPILCMFAPDDRPNVRKVFGIVQSQHASELEIHQAMAWLENADFYGRLSDAAERDRCFMKYIVGDYTVLLKDADAVRRELKANVKNDTPYYWLGSEEVRNVLKKLFDEEYRRTGRDRARAILDTMSAEQLRRYLYGRIDTEMGFGLQILKDEP